MKRVEQMTFWERIYLPEIFRGLVVTGYRFWRNLFLNVAHQVGLLKNRRSMVTVQYPEERKRYGDHYRGSHRLTLKEDGSVRCTSCFLCATACPANCIYIEAAESPDPKVEKYPAALRDRHAALHLLRLLRRGVPLRCDSHGHQRPSANLGLFAARFRRDQGSADGALAGDRQRGRGALMEDMLKSYRS